MKSIHIRGEQINYCNNEEHFLEVQYEIWEKETFDVLDRFLTSKSVFLDIGAWAGTLSLYSAKKGVICHSYEPDPVALDYLTDNVAANDYTGSIFIHRKAVSDVDEEIKIYGCYGDSMSSPTRGGDEYKTIEAVAFKSLLTPEVSLIKIDTEGGEAKIMNEKCLYSLYEANYPPILLSVHPDWIPDYDNWWEHTQKVFSQFYKIELVSHNCYLFTR